MNLKLIATAALLVVACQSYAESYTYYQNENGTVTVQRDEGLYSAEPSVVSSCIALPVSWSDNVEATINGTASATHFSAALNIDTDNAALMNSNWSYPGFNWSCFSDIARSYERGEKVLVSFTLKPGVADMLAFTTLGFYESEYLGIPFPRNIATHRLLQDAYVGDHWMPVSDELDRRKYSPYYSLILRDAEAYYFLFSESDSDPSGTAMMRLDEHGLQPVAGTPDAHNIYFLNNKYIAIKAGEADGPEEDTVYINYSDDLKSWQAGADLKLQAGMELTGIYYNAVVGEYLAVSGDFNTSDFYSSTDLQSWTYAGKGPEDFYAEYITLTNGNMLYMAEGERYNTEFFIKPVGESSWTEITPFPEGTPPEGRESGFLIQDYHQNSDGTLQVVGLYGYGGEYEYYWYDVLYGYSENGVDWTWKVIGEWSDPYEEIGNIIITDSVIFISNGETSEILLSIDGGESWQTRNTETVLADRWNMPEGVVIEQDNINVAGETFFIKFSLLIPEAESSNRFNIMGYAYISTSDFEHFQLEGFDNGDSLVMPEVGGNRFRIQEDWHRDVVKFYRYGSAVRDTDDGDGGDTDNSGGDETGGGDGASPGKSEGGSSGGSLWFLNLLLLPLVLRTVKRKRIYAVH